MSSQIAQHVYDLYGRFYDGFQFFFRRRIAKAIRHMPLRPGDRVLDIGVGTGISLDYYPDSVDVTGLDLSAGMLAQARKKLDAGHLRPGALHRTRLIQGDALNLPFENGAFDCVFMSHMIATVPNPHRALAEAVRVCREGAAVVMVNHFRNRFPLVSWVETAIDPICRKLGWRCDLSLADLLKPTGIANPRHAFGTIFQTVYLTKRNNTLVLSAPSADPAMQPTFDNA